jgi:hypothetical protein
MRRVGEKQGGRLQALALHAKTRDLCAQSQKLVMIGCHVAVASLDPGRWLLALARPATAPRGIDPKMASRFRYSVALIDHQTHRVLLAFFCLLTSLLRHSGPLLKGAEHACHSVRYD